MNKLQPLSPWRNRRQAAEYLGISPFTIDRYKRRGLLIPKFLGRLPLYHTRDLDNLLTRQPQPV